MAPLTKRRLLLVAAVCGVFSFVLVVLIVWGSQKAQRIAYHRWRMENAKAHFHSGGGTPVSEGLVRYDISKVLPVYEYHRDQLVLHGYFFHARYDFNQLPEDDGVHKAIIHRLREAFPDNHHWTLSYPDNELLAWDRPHRRAEWDSFVAKHNVADFIEQFVE